MDLWFSHQLTDLAGLAEPDQRELLLLNAEAQWCFNPIVKALGWTNNAWSFLMNRSGSPIGLIRNDETSGHCEWYGEQMSQLLKITDDGLVIGFGRRLILLKLAR